MAIAIERPTPTQQKPRRLLKPAQLAAGLLYRLWWHFKAYSMILGIMLLTLGSLIVLWGFDRWESVAPEKPTWIDP